MPKKNGLHLKITAIMDHLLQMRKSVIKQHRKADGKEVEDAYEH